MVIFEANRPRMSDHECTNTRPFVYSFPNSWTFFSANRIAAWEVVGSYHLSLGSMYQLLAKEHSQHSPDQQQRSTGHQTQTENKEARSHLAL